MRAEGLKNQVVCTTKISAIEEDHLSYAGYDIAELMDHSVCFEEVIYLLWHLFLPTETDLEAFQQELKREYAMSDAIEQCLLIQSRKHLHPMSVLRSTVSLLGVYHIHAEENTDQAVYQQGIQMMAKVPTIIAAFSRLRKGQPPIAPREDLGLAENFLYMLTGEKPDSQAVEIFDKALILHADHELNASTFAARVSASTLTDLYSCITTAIGTLKGSLHGGANERVFDMLVEIRQTGDTDAYLQERLDSHQKIMGFGHRVYQKVDPRQPYLKQMAYRLTKGTENEVWYRLSEEVENFIRNKKKLIPNVDFYSATVYHVLGIDRDIFTLIFAMSRMAGWIAHVNEQRKNNRLIRPRSIYDGEKNRLYQPITERREHHDNQ